MSLPSSKLVGSIALLGIVALLGGGRVSAAHAAIETTICKTSNAGQLCPLASRFGATVYKGTGAVSFTGPGESFACNSEIEFKTSAISGTPLGAEVTGWTLTGCVNNGNTCTSSAWSTLPFSMEIGWTSGDNGVGKIRGVSSALLAKFACPGGVSCTYSLLGGGTPSIPFEIVGGAPAKGSFSAMFGAIGGIAACSEMEKAVGTYKFTAPASGTFYVEHT